MSYIFKSSNPVEASFAEAFFQEKGFTCKLIPTGGIYGLQNYDVSVAGNVGPEMENELKLRLQELARAEGAPETVEEVSVEE